MLPRRACPDSGRCQPEIDPRAIRRNLECRPDARDLRQRPSRGDFGNEIEQALQIAVPYEQARYPLHSVWSELIVADVIGFIDHESSRSATRPETGGAPDSQSATSSEYSQSRREP